MRMSTGPRLPNLIPMWTKLHLSFLSSDKQLVSMSSQPQQTLSTCKGSSRMSNHHSPTLRSHQPTTTEDNNCLRHSPYRDVTPHPQSATSPPTPTPCCSTPIGVAAFNVDGHTLHSLLSLPTTCDFKDLEGERLNKLQQSSSISSLTRCPWWGGSPLVQWTDVFIRPSLTMHRKCSEDAPAFSLEISASFLQ